jgi:hypothetical protein
MKKVALPNQINLLLPPKEKKICLPTKRGLGSYTDIKIKDANLSHHLSDATLLTSPKEVQ